jgi:DNA recombination protein RmuC
MDWSVLFVMNCVLLVLTMAACAWLASQRTSLTRECGRLQRDLDQANRQVDSYREEISNLKAGLDVAQETQRGLVKQFEEAQRNARETFESLAGKVLNQSSEQFLRLANQNFQSKQQDATAQLDQRKHAIDEMLKPLKTSLSEYKQTIQAIETERKQDKGTLTEQIVQLSGLTSSLDRSLRHPGSRGQWGQFTLRRVAELAGMVSHCDFDEQVSVQTPDGRLQPDMVVRLPNDRTIVVDAKAPGDSYKKATDTQSDEERKGLLQSHAQAVEGHVRQLASKQYSQQFDGSPDFVVLFLPAESMLYAALGARPELLDAAMEKGVVIATPSILVALLRAVAVGWREQRVTENAKRISDLGQELHSRIVTMIEHYTRLGNTLESTVTHYNRMGASLESRVLPQAQKLAEFGADSPKALPQQLHQIENSVRPQIKVVVDDTAQNQAHVTDA